MTTTSVSPSQPATSSLLASSSVTDQDAPSAFERYQQTRVFPALDGLRCISILGVIAFHAGLPNPSFFGAHGGLGVQFFFVISGFLITTLLLREQRDTGGVSLKKFYIRRTLRIFPLYYSVLLAYCLVTFLHMRHVPADSADFAHGQEFFRRIPIFLTYTSNWFMPADGHFALSWSLSTEEQFYLFWPGIVCLFPRRPWAPLAAIAAIAVGDQALELLIYGYRAFDLGEIANRTITSLQTPICLGCVVAYLLHWRRSFVAAWHILRHPWFPGFMMLLAMALSCIIPMKDSDLPDHYLIKMGESILVSIPMAEQTMVRLDQGMLLLMTLLGCAIVASCCAGTGGVLRPILTNRLVRHIGVVSYGMYLMHQLCLKSSDKIVAKIPFLPHGPTLNFAVGVVVTVIVATLSYRYYESYFLRLKDRLAKRPEKPRPAEPAAPQPAA